VTERTTATGELPEGPRTSDGSAPIFRAVFCKICISVVGCVVATSAAGCGGTGAPAASSASSVAAPSASNTAVDPEVAHRHLEKAARPFECSDAFTEMGDAHHDRDFTVMRDKAREYRDVVATWDAELDRIAFPAAAEQIIDKIRALNATELDGLNEIAAGGSDTGRISVVRSRVEADDAATMVEGDRLRAALGHPVPPAGYAADQLESAAMAFLKDRVQVWSRFEAARDADDVDGMKAASAMEIAAFERYSDELGIIVWPPGHEERVSMLRETLRTLIESDRREGTVADATESAQEPKEGVPTLRDLRAAKQPLWVDLVREYQAADPSGKC
jgi:hypothetical protein